MPGRDVTQLLLELRGGRREALAELLPLVYQELRWIASQRLAHQGGQTLSATALVHEAYLKMFDQTQLAWNDRKHFFAVASMAMRQLVVDNARRKRAAKHGGGLQRVDLEAIQIGVADPSEEVLSLDEALTRLSRLDERLARVVEMRYFGGLSVEETAEALDLDPRTIKRDWRKARALLYRTLKDPEDR
jgi:RNA polymerase sigma factor (TIGR02999 family)